MTKEQILNNPVLILDLLFESETNISILELHPELKGIHLILFEGQDLKSQLKSHTAQNKQIPPIVYNDFLAYWSEPIQNSKKKGIERWQAEKTWDVNKRIRTWIQNAKKFGRPYKMIEEQKHIR